jgi:phage-related holin
MKNYFIKFLAVYDWNSFEEFALSIFPSYKYQLHGAVLTLSVLSGLVNYLFGVTPALAIAMFVAIVIEVITGIRASKRLGKKFESFRFSRCVIKILIWLAILYIIHAFQKEFENSKNWIDIAAENFFNFTFIVCLTGFLVEYVTSILENVSVLKGKEKTAIIEAISGGWLNLINSIKPKKNEN